MQDATTYPDCGTYTAFGRHQREGSQPCDSCIDAARAYWRERERRKTHGSAMLPTIGCRICGVEVEQTLERGRRLYCSDDCRAEKQLRRSRHRRGTPDVRLLTCANCGKEWEQAPTRGGVHTYCSEACSNEVRGDRRRARKLDAFVAPVSRQRIFERDGWRCGICGKKVDKRKRHPHPMAATLDHIIPLAAGGTHEPANVQCAHARCNSSKRDRPANDQLRLVG